MLCLSAVAFGADQYGLANNVAPSWEEMTMDAACRNKSHCRNRRHRCRPPLPKTHIADGVKFNYCDSLESPLYKRMYKFMLPFVPYIEALTALATNQAAYQNLLNECIAIVNNYNGAFNVTSGRVVIVDADGLVLVDTGKSNNTYQNAIDGANPSTFASAINVNHNSRVAILDAQQYDAGVGVETKLSNSTGTEQSYVAIRLGPILHNVGTFRLSQNTL
jgi:hypothetical protein